MSMVSVASHVIDAVASTGGLLEGVRQVRGCVREMF